MIDLKICNLAYSYSIDPSKLRTIYDKNKHILIYINNEKDWDLNKKKSQIGSFLIDKSSILIQLVAWFV